MMQDENGAIFRGNGKCKAVLAINQVDDLDVLDLVEKHEGAPGEQTIFVFPVRSQVTWYRAKYAKGFIETEIAKEDEYRALVKASVYDDGGLKLSVAHGTATAEGDGVNGFKLIETAESRAISRALDAAGFGCQLSAKTYDLSDDPGGVPAPGTAEETPSEKMPALPNEAPVPSKTPDQINPSRKVFANGASQPEDISSLSKDSESKSDAGTGSESGKKADGRKKKADQPAPEPSGETQKQPETAPGDTSVAAKTEPETPNAAQSVEEIVEEAIKALPDIQPDSFDPLFFGEGPIDPNAFYVNKKGVTAGMRNSDLQNAINFLVEHKGMAQQVKFLTQNKQLEGKTFAQVFDMGELGKQAIKTCAIAYAKKNVTMMAAALMFYFKSSKKNESGSQE